VSTPTTVLPFQPATMSTAQLAAVSYLARYAGRTHALYAFQLRKWFSWCDNNGLDPLVAVQRAHVELYIRQLGERGLMDSSVVTSMHALRGYFRFAHIDGLIPADPAVYARLPKIHRDDSRTQGLDRLELIRFLQVAQTITVHHGALVFLLGINALRSSEAAAVRIEDYADTLRGYQVLHLVGKGNKPATMPLTVPVLRVLEACRGQRVSGPLILRPILCHRTRADGEHRRRVARIVGHRRPRPVVRRRAGVRGRRQDARLPDRRAGDRARPVAQRATLPVRVHLHRHRPRSPDRVHLRHVGRRPPPVDIAHHDRRRAPGR